MPVKQPIALASDATLQKLAALYNESPSLLVQSKAALAAACGLSPSNFYNHLAALTSAGLAVLHAGAGVGQPSRLVITPTGLRRALDLAHQDMGQSGEMEDGDQETSMSCTDGENPPIRTWGLSGSEEDGGQPTSMSCKPSGSPAGARVVKKGTSATPGCSPGVVGVHSQKPPVPPPSESPPLSPDFGSRSVIPHSASLRGESLMTSSSIPARATSAPAGNVLTLPVRKPPTPLTVKVGKALVSAVAIPGVDGKHNCHQLYVIALQGGLPSEAMSHIYNNLRLGPMKPWYSAALKGTVECLKRQYVARWAVSVGRDVREHKDPVGAGQYWSRIAENILHLAISVDRFLDIAWNSKYKQLRAPTLQAMAGPALFSTIQSGSDGVEDTTGIEKGADGQTFDELLERSIEMGAWPMDMDTYRKGVKG